jgi:hypothetical protein
MFLVAFAVASSLGFVLMSNVIPSIEIWAPKHALDISMIVQMTVKFSRVSGDPINDPKPNLY